MKPPPRINLRKPINQSSIAFLVSTCVHLIIFVSLALIVMVSEGKSVTGLSFTIGDDPLSERTEFTEFEISAAAAAPLSSLETEEINQVDTSVAETPSVSLNLPSISSTTEASVHSSVFDQALMASMAGGGGGGADGEAKKLAKTLGPGASFFGVEAKGNRFVYVIDSSRSMQGPRWQALCKELIRAIQSLSPDQEFFVISFDYEAHPMFGTLPPRGSFLKPTKDNVERLKNWVNAIIHGRATLPASSIGIALRMQPDAIFLLSDGEINDQTVSDLRVFNRKQDESGETHVMIPIHTVLLHSDEGYETLRVIAEENDGVFTPVSLFRFNN